MRQKLTEYRLFWREFRDTFHATGAVLPSGRSLSRALASRIGTEESGQRILEVGPGTGAVTGEILARLRPADQLDLVELNPRFAARLRQRLATEARWSAVAQQVQVLEMPVEELTAAAPYDRIVSGLPLNNFSCTFVAQIFAQFHRLAAPQAELSFFEYVAIRSAKALCSQADERRRLIGIQRLLHDQFTAWQVARQCVLANVPPAWVHHLCLPGGRQRPPFCELPLGRQ